MEAPCLASSLAIDRPMPRPAPVITATLWASMASSSGAPNERRDGAAVVFELSQDFKAIVEIFSEMLSVLQMASSVTPCRPFL